MPVKKQKNKKRLVLLDTHAILHRAYHALPDFSTRDGKPTGALYGLASMLMKIVDDLNPDYLVACYDLPGPTHRHDAYKEYKATRKETDAELVDQLKSSREVLDAFNVPHYEEKGYEADDLLGTIVEETKGEKDLEVIIASGDMDTLQLVDKKRVRVYTLRRGMKDTVLYDEKAVKERYGFDPDLLPDYKGLCGDPSDNIIGVKGVGDKTATTLITTYGAMEKIYQALRKDEEKFLEKTGFTKRVANLLKDNEEEALFSKMLAEIKRDAPIDFSLSKKEWREGLDGDAIFALFKKLEFRKLSARAEKRFDIEREEEEIEEDVPKKDLRETAVALWLIDSSRTNPSLEDIYAYTKVTKWSEAKEKIFKELEDKDLTGVFENIEKPLIPIVEKMQQRGIKVDTDYLGKLSKKYHDELSVVEKKIYKAAGEEFNINSPKQLSEILFEKLELKKSGIKKTSTGARSTQESELQKLADEHPIIEHILTHREIQKLLSTYIDVLPKLTADDGRLHAEFLQTGTTTGRMASQHPNLQNIPIRSKRGQPIRNAFVAEEGYVLVALDYSQVELRIAAMLSRDPKFLEIFKNEEDVHKAVAAEVFDKDPDKITTAERAQAKTINFGILYGMGVNALRSNLGEEVSRKEAKAFYDEYFNTFKELTAYLEKTKRDAKKKGYTTTYFGRKRYFEGINSKLPYIRAQAERMAINAPIQGTQADVIKIAMGRIEEYVTETGVDDEVRLLLQVHDELVFEIKKEETARHIEELKKCMESVLTPLETGGITLKVKAETGPSWGEMSEV